MIFSFLAFQFGTVLFNFLLASPFEIPLLIPYPIAPSTAPDANAIQPSEKDFILPSKTPPTTLPNSEDNAVVPSPAIAPLIAAPKYASSPEFNFPSSAISFIPVVTTPIATPIITGAADPAVATEIAHAATTIAAVATHFNVIDNYLGISPFESYPLIGLLLQ